MAHLVAATVIGHAALAPSVRAADRTDQAPTAPYIDSAHVPRIFTREPALFADLLLAAHATPKKIAHFGDSTSTDIVGAGHEHLSWRRWLWHQRFGHTPGTQLSPMTKYIGVPPGQFLQAQNVLELDPSIVPDSFLLPGFYAGQATPTAATCQIGPNLAGRGIFLLLNHNNDNNQTLGTGSTPLLFIDVPAAVHAGVPLYATGTMLGGASLIDTRNGLRLEVIAATHPNSVADVSWKLRPLPTPATNNVGAPVIQSGTLFGGAQSLHAPVGSFFKAVTPPLAQLSGTQGAYQIELAGNTTSGDPSQSAQIIGARFRSANPAGLIIDSLSAGGFTSETFPSLFPDSGALLRTIDYDAAWIDYGTNDQFDPATAAQFEGRIRALIAFLRSASRKPALPIILEASHHVTFQEDPQADLYASALYRIARTTPQTLFVNNRRILRERFGWGGDSDSSYLMDGVHYTAFGAESFARCSIETTIGYLTQSPQALTFVRQPDSLNGKDTYLSKQMPNSEYGVGTWMFVGADAAGAGVWRSLINFDSLHDLPPNAAIQSAQLVLTVSVLAASPQPMEIDRCTRPDWNEGLGDGSGATWMVASNIPYQPWTTPGGDYTTAGQVRGLALPAAPAQELGAKLSYDITALAHDAIDNHQGMLSLLLKRVNENPAGSGVLAKSAFFTSENFEAFNRPMLVVNYVAAPTPLGDPCPADIAPAGGDFHVTIDDLLAVIAAWGPCPPQSCPADVNGSGAVDIDDLLMVINGWGSCP